MLHVQIPPSGVETGSETIDMLCHPCGVVSLLHDSRVGEDLRFPAFRAGTVSGIAYVALEGHIITQAEQN